MNDTKEELRKEFDEAFEAKLKFNAGYPDEPIFDWFYSKLSSKQKEVDELENDIRVYRNGHEVNAKRYADALKQISELTDKLKAFEWIPVGERLPEVGEKVLVMFSKIGNSLIGKLYNDNVWSVYYSDGESAQSIKSEQITHWMPLPPSPQSIKE